MDDKEYLRRERRARLDRAKRRRAQLLRLSSMAATIAAGLAAGYEKAGSAAARPEIARNAVDLALAIDAELRGRNLLEEEGVPHDPQ
jgi:hypothetical protein